MGNIDKIQLPNGNTYDINDTYKSGIYTVIGTQTAATASWTGDLHGVSTLYTGLTINYYLPYAGVSSTNVTLNLTLDDGTTTGAVNCYINTSRLTTHYGAGRTIVMTYYKAGDISISGTATTDNRWICDAYYDTNSDTKVRQTLSTTNKNYPLLLSYAESSTTTTNIDNVSYRANTIYANPSTGNIHATKLNGVDIGSSPKFTDTNKYHKTGSWSGLTYTATAVNSAEALAFTIPTGSTATTVSAGNHTHTTSLASDTGTSTVSMSANTKYKLTAGGTSVIFTTPADSNTTYSLTQDSTNGHKITLTPSSGTAQTVTIPDNDTKNTAGSTDTSSKIFLIGATSQAANPQTYSDNEVFATSGVLTTKSVQIGGGSCTLQFNSTTQACDFVFS